MKRTIISETIKNIGSELKVSGWIHTRRDHGKITFLDLRDMSGIIQIVFIPGSKAYDRVTKVRPEWVVSVTGKINRRPEKMVNADLPTGTIEMEAVDLEVLNEAKTTPFEVDKDTFKVNEETRLKYRYLDLRSLRMTRNMTLRHNIVKFIREYMDEEGFREIETPYVTKSTPEGAREYIVPSRLYPGKFYSLPQSPQQFKQLLMVAGIEKYYQIARCFRDEDQRGDRQPEFTQLDLEMSFVEREDVMSLTEDLLIKLVKKVTPEKTIQEVPFPRFSYKEAMNKYRTDRPDLRKDKTDPNLLAFCWVIDFPFFEKTESGEWTFTHNPFSSPVPEHMPWLMEKKNIDQILTTQYDIVLNSYEIGGGSIRNHQPEPLRKVFEIMNMSDDQIEEQFGHMLEAFTFGAPPHGGIAPGLDRVVMILANEPNIREVIAFPKTGDARDPMMGAPSVVSDKQLKEAHISVSNVKGSKDSKIIDSRI